MSGKGRQGREWFTANQLRVIALARLDAEVDDVTTFEDAEDLLVRSWWLTGGGKKRGVELGVWRRYSPQR